MDDRHATGWKLPSGQAAVANELARIAEFIAPIRAAQQARQEGYCEVAVDVRLLDRLLAVVRAATETGPWPKVIDDGDYGLLCCHCGQNALRDRFRHADDCSGIALRDALAALDGTP